ncbi:MAG: phage tail protein [Bacteroidia bacterium]
MEGVIGFVTCFAGNFAPKSWAFCQGQIVNIASNTALFSIVGTVYGGNGTTTFGLPDLRGRSVVGVGQGPGLSQYSLGQVGGSTNVTINQLQMPVHVHAVSAQITPKASDTGNNPNPGNGVYATASNGSPSFASAPTTSMQGFNAALTTSPNGGNQPFSIQHPVMGMNYIVCTQGVYPARN